MRRCSILVIALAACGRFGFDDDSRARDSDVDTAVVTDGDGAVLVQRFAYIKPSNTGSFDQFGYAIAMSSDGSTLVVGAPQEDDVANATQQSGAAYVFARSGSTWIEQGYIKANDPFPDDLFGAAVAIAGDGNTIAIGAYAEDSASRLINTGATNTAAPDAGAVYIFVRSGGAWLQQAYIKAANTDIQDRFGYSVALSGTGDVLAVGAPFEDSSAMGVGGDDSTNNASNSGAVYTFTRNASTWSPQSYIKASNPDIDDYFGWTIALSADGTTLAASAPEEDSATTVINGNESDDSLMQTGAAYAFVRSGATWVQQAYIKPPNIDFGDYFGRALTLSADGNELACASPGEDAIVANSGAVFTFVRSGTTWTPLTKLKASSPGDGDNFGFGIAIAPDASFLLVGAPNEDSDGVGVTTDPMNEASTDSGAVYAFARGTLGWTVDSFRKPAHPSVGDQFGTGVAIGNGGLARAVSSLAEDSAATGIDGDALDESADGAGAVEITYY